MPAPIYDIFVNQYASFDMTMQLNDSTGSALPIINWGFTGSIKTNVDTDPPITKFNIIVVDITSSLINISLIPCQSALLNKPQYMYDILATNNNVNPVEVYRLVQGKVKVSLGVTDLDSDN